MLTKKKTNIEKRTSEELFAEVDALRSRAKELRKEAKRKRELEERQRREREFHERVESALEFYERKDVFEKAYQIYREAQTISIQNGNRTIYDWVNDELKKHEPYDWHDEVVTEKNDDTQSVSETKN